MRNLTTVTIVIAALTAGLNAETWEWTGDGDGERFSDPENWLVADEVPQDGPDGDDRLDYVFNPAGGGEIRLGRQYRAGSITFGPEAGSFTFTGEAFRNARGYGAESPMSIVQNSSAEQTFDVDMVWMHDGINFSGEGTGNVEFTGEHSMGNRRSQINVDTTTYRPVWEGDMLAGHTWRERNFGGEGTFEIAGASSPGGSNSNVTVNTLLITAAEDHALGSTDVHIHNGATLAGTGNVTTGTATIYPGGGLSPGVHGPATNGETDIGTLNVGDLTLQPGFTYRFDTKGERADRVKVAERLVLAQIVEDDQENADDADNNEDAEQPDEEPEVIGHIGDPGTGETVVTVHIEPADKDENDEEADDKPADRYVLFEASEGVFEADSEQPLTSGILNWKVDGVDMVARIDGRKIVLVRQ